MTFVFSHLRHRPVRAVALGGAVLFASVSFILLASAAKTSEIRVRGSVESNFRNAYDVLVRPRGSFTALERRQGLVRENYLSGIFGGITLEQWAAIKRIRGVEVAAPIANVGYVLGFGFFELPITDVLTEEPVQLYRLRPTWLAHRGTSRYRDDDAYIYFTRRSRFECCGAGVVEITPAGDALELSIGINAGRPLRTGPFSRVPSVWFFSALSPGQGSDHPSTAAGRWSDLQPGAPTLLYFPILLAAIDPHEETRLLDIDETIVSGRFLRSDDRPQHTKRDDGSGFAVVPVVASTRTYVDEHLHVEVERLVIPESADVPRLLASARGYPFLTALRGRTVAVRTIPSSKIYGNVLRRTSDPFSYWQPAQSRYRVVGATRLAAEPTTNPISVWSSPFYPGGYWPAPRSNADVQFRRLRTFVGSNERRSDGTWSTPQLKVVGRYDPDKLPGFSPLSRVPLETYYPPTLPPADEGSRRALKGRPLLPTQNLGDYVQQPPLFLTTLEGMRPYLEPARFAGASPKAPISVIRVRVAGVTGPDDLSMARIRAVALAIRDRTGLDVDITAGSSPRELHVDLPPGKFGRPALTVAEGWVKKGVSVSFLRAVDEKSLALFTLIPLICACFLANGAFAAARARRTEIGTLLCLGWSQSAIFRVLLGELALIGFLAGLAGTAIAAAIALAFSLDMSLARTLLVLPVSVLVALAAGVVPAWIAARSVPLDAVRPAVVDARRRQRVRSLAAMAAANLRRVRARAAVGTLGLFVGAAAFTVLFGIYGSFAGTLVGTLLGDAILVRIQGVDFFAVGLTVALAALSIADVLFLNLRERAAELVTLRTVGWHDSHLRKLVVLEAIGLGLFGGAGGALMGFVLGIALLDVPALPLALAALAAAAGGVVVAVLASLLPLSQIRRLTPPAVLAAE